MSRQMVKWMYIGNVSYLTIPDSSSDDENDVLVPSISTLVCMNPASYTVIAKADTPFHEIRKRIINAIYNDISTYKHGINKDNIIINEEMFSITKCGTSYTLYSTYNGPVSLCIQVNTIDGKSFIRELAKFNGVYKLAMICNEADILNRASIDMQLMDFIEGIKSAGIIEKASLKSGCSHINQDDVLIILNGCNIKIWGNDEDASLYYDKACEEHFNDCHHITILKDHYSTTDDVYYISAEEDENYD